MYRVTFNLKKPKGKHESLMNMVIFHDGKRLKFSTRQKVNPRFWDFKKRTVSKSKAKLEASKEKDFGIEERLSNVQQALNGLKGEVDKYFLESKLAGKEPRLSIFSRAIA